MKEEKQMENVKYFKYFGSMINDRRSTREINSRIAMAKQHSSERRLFSSKLSLNVRKKLVKCYI
jgi:hypothetical protein